jgi:hypothetical protein
VQDAGAGVNVAPFERQPFLRPQTGTGNQDRQ